MKLHLGCGQRYFEGYINIDYPLTEHSVQQESIADVHANLQELQYPISTVDEIRLHHVFEHFSRPESLAMLTIWNSWLKDDGILIIEVPNFYRSAIEYFNPFRSQARKAVALRHIFGSQEAHWAIHFEGYSKRLFKNILPKFGFKIEKFEFNNWKGTYNILVTAKKIDSIKYDNAIISAKSHLSEYLVTKTESEISLLDKWIVDFQNQLFRSSFVPKK